MLSPSRISAANIYWDLRSKMPLFPYAQMVVVERAELWRPANEREEPRFVESMTIWRADTEFFLQYSHFKYATSDEPYFTDGEILRIPESHVYPTHGEYPVADTTENRYVETPTCIEWDFRDGPLVMYPRDAFKRQTELVEPLLQSPHRNVAKLFGCRVQWYWMDGLVFEKYERCLADMEPDEIRALNANQIIDGISRGIKHLHSLGVVHQAIYPKNIRLDTQGRPVIVNFRNADYEGEPLSYEAIELIEHSYNIWSHRGSEHSQESYSPKEYFQWIEDDHPKTHEDIDYFGLIIIRDFLREPARYASLNQSCRKIYWDCRKNGHIGSSCCTHQGRDFDILTDDGEEEAAEENIQEAIEEVEDEEGVICA